MEKLKNNTIILSENADLFVKNYMIDIYKSDQIDKSKILLENLDLSDFKNYEVGEHLAIYNHGTYFYLLVENDLRKRYGTVLSGKVLNVYRLIKDDDLFGHFELLTISTNGFEIDESSNIK